MSLFILRRNGIPIAVWLGTNIMQPSISLSSDNIASQSPAPSPLKQEKLQYGFEKGASLYRRIVDYLSLEIKDRVQRKV